MTFTAVSLPGSETVGCVGDHNAIAFFGMSALGQKRTPFGSFDDLVGSQQEACGNVVIHCLCGLEIDSQFEGAWLLYRQVSGLCAAKNFGDDCGALAKNINEARTITKQTAIFGSFWPLKDGGQSKFYRPINDGPA